LLAQFGDLGVLGVQIEHGLDARQRRGEFLELLCGVYVCHGPKSRASGPCSRSAAPPPLPRTGSVPGGAGPAAAENGTGAGPRGPAPVVTPCSAVPPAAASLPGQLPEGSPPHGERGHGQPLCL